MLSSPLIGFFSLLFSFPVCFLGLLFGFIICLIGLSYGLPIGTIGLLLSLLIFLMDLVKELGDYLRGLAPKATIRNGDYPREKTMMEITLILSGLSNVEKIRDYYGKSTKLIPEFKRRQEEAESRLKGMEDMGKDIPSLL